MSYHRRDLARRIARLEKTLNNRQAQAPHMDPERWRVFQREITALKNEYLDRYAPHLGSVSDD
jgi:hypothetical protein